METKVIEISGSGLPCMWESGGGMRNTGSVDLICDKQGNPKKAVFIRRISNGGQVLIPITVGDYVINIYRYHSEFEIHIHRVNKIDKNAKICYLEEKHKYRYGGWDNEPPDFLFNVTEVGKKKTLHYHCRESYYIRRKIEEVK